MLGIRRYFTHAPNNLHNLSSPWLFSMWEMDILGSLPKAPRQVKFLLVVIDYFTKWIEARPLWDILVSAVKKFTWKHLTCSNLPYAIVTNKGTQFKAQAYEEFLSRLGIKHFVTSVEHPQTNGQVEAANRVILKALCMRLDKSKGLRKAPPNILWAYHCSPQMTTKETLFRRMLPWSLS